MAEQHTWSTYPHEKPLLVGVDISNQPGRYRRMTASAVSGSVGLTKYAFPQVLARHFHESGFCGNENTIRGQIMEPVTRYLLEVLTHGLMPIRQCGIFVCPELRFFSATPDDLAYVDGAERVLEYKSVDPGTPRDAPKLEHIGQVHWQMMCSGLTTRGYLVYNYLTLPRPEVVEADDGTPGALVLDPGYRPTLEDAERLKPVADRVLEMFRRRWTMDRARWTPEDRELIARNMLVWEIRYSPAFVGWMTERAMEFGLYVDCPDPAHEPSYSHLYFDVNRALHAGEWGRGVDDRTEAERHACIRRFASPQLDPREWPPSPTVVDWRFEDMVPREALERKLTEAEGILQKRLKRPPAGPPRNRYKIVPAGGIDPPSPPHRPVRQPDTRVHPPHQRQKKPASQGSREHEDQGFGRETAEEPAAQAEGVAASAAAACRESLSGTGGDHDDALEGWTVVTKGVRPRVSLHPLSHGGTPMLARRGRVRG